MTTKQETGLQLLSRLQRNPDLSLDTNLFPNGCNRAMVEISGSEGSGKTQTLTHLLASCILIAEWQGVPLGGNNNQALLFDTDYHFNFLRLVALLERRIHSAHPQISDEDVEAVVKKSLANVWIIRCSTSSQLLVSIHACEHLLIKEPALRLLLLDSIAGNYWQDRSNGGDGPHCHEKINTQIVDVLKKFHEKYGISVVASTSAPLSGQYRTQDSSCNATSSSLHTVLARNWQTKLTHRVHLSKQPTPGGKFSYKAVVTKPEVAERRELPFVITDSGIQFT